MKRYVMLIVLGLLWMPLSLSAKTLVFIHGFLGDAASWRENQVTLPLDYTAWVNGGVYRYTPYGVSMTNVAAMSGRNIYYAVNLPSKAGIVEQSLWLNQQLSAIYAARQEPLILVGHSVGGVVARYWLVIQNHVPVSALATIATPHLGTPHAEIAYHASKPFTSALERFLPIDVPEQLLRDIRPESKGQAASNFLFWLNRQKHPDIAYLSIIRRNNVKAFSNYTKRDFDLVVPPYSQNMNYVYALRGRSRVVLQDQDHLLSPQDGVWLARFVNAL